MIEIMTIVGAVTGFIFGVLITVLIAFLLRKTPRGVFIVNVTNPNAEFIECQFYEDPEYIFAEKNVLMEVRKR